MKKIYLEDTPLEQAQERFLSTLKDSGLWKTGFSQSGQGYE